LKYISNYPVEYRSVGKFTLQTKGETIMT